MQSLEARVAYLEGLLQQVRPDVAVDHLLGFEGERFIPQLSGGDNLGNPLGSASEPNISHQDTAGGGVYEDAAAAPSVDAEDPADQLSAEVALLCLNAAGREPHYFGPSSAVSFSRIVSAAMNLPKKVGSSSRSQPGLENIGWGSTRPPPIPFPMPALASTLSKAYFNNIHPQYPFLHRPTFQYWEEHCLKADAGGSLEVAGDVPLFFCWMVRNVKHGIIFDHIFLPNYHSFTQSHRWLWGLHTTALRSHITPWRLSTSRLSLSLIAWSQSRVFFVALYTLFDRLLGLAYGTSTQALPKYCMLTIVLGSSQG